MGKTAIILGITGLTGGLLAQRLFEEEEFAKVISFHRRKSGLKHPKLTEYVIDMGQIQEQKDLFTGDVVFCCIGTTQAKTKDKDTYRAIDYGIPVDAAKLAKANAIPKFIVMSALGADPNSRLFYSKTKGEMERDVLAQKIPETYFMQPSLLNGDRKEARLGEKLANVAFKIINPLLMGSLKKYRSIEPSTVARAMLDVAQKGYSQTHIPSDEIEIITSDHTP